MNPTRQLCLLALAVFALGGGFADHASAGVVDPALRRTLDSYSPTDHISVIVHLQEKAAIHAIRDKTKGARRSRIVKALRSKAAATQADLTAELRQKRAERIRHLWIANAVAATVPSDAVEELAARADVERVVFDAVVRAPVSTPGAAGVPEWNLSAIHAPDLWNLGFTGQGVVVANMDSGVDYDHADLQNRWRGGQNSWYDPSSEHPLEPHDATGHGTQTMGIMVGGDAGGTSIGVAPGARWIAVKIFNDAGDTTYSVIHQGFQWLLDPDGNPDTDDAPDVVNHSWGLQDPTHGCITEFQADVEALRAAGIAQSFSAGNDGPNPATGVSPANYPASLAIGAVDAANTVMGSSSRGPSACGGTFPSVVAPGANVRTSDLYVGIPGAYTTVSGTSFASPHVAGAMALLLSAFPTMTVSELEYFLKATADDIGTAGTDNDSGSGIVDALGAYEAALSSPRGSVVINGGAATTSTRPVTLSLSASDTDDAVAAMRFSWDNVVWYGWEPYAASRNATLPAGDGTKTIHVRFRDAAGNVSAVYTDSILLDTAPPAGSVSISGGAATTRNRPVTLSLSAADTANTVAAMGFSWDNVVWYGWEPYATTRNATLPAGDGTKTIHVRFRDAAGNVSTLYTDSILLDTVPPAGSVAINGGAATTGTRPVTLSLSATDTANVITAMRFSWDNVIWYGWEPYAATRNATLPGVAPGTYTIRVQFRDAAGNLSPAYADPITYDP